MYVPLRSKKKKKRNYDMPLIIKHISISEMLNYLKCAF